MTTGTTPSTAPVGYQYVVLRCVPEVQREEFVNVGVVVYSQSADYLEAAWRLDEDRLRAFAPGLDLGAGCVVHRRCRRRSPLWRAVAAARLARRRP